MGEKMPKVTCIYPEIPGQTALSYANFAQAGAQEDDIPPSRALLNRLVAIERAVGHTDHLELRAMLMDAQGDAIRMQAELVSVLTEMARLRESYEKCGRSALSPVNARAEEANAETRFATSLRARTA